MDIAQLSQGTYIVAVSGGIDSVVLLDILSKIDGLRLVIAHIDHGIRKESVNDADFVRKLAGDYIVDFELHQANLGPRASEADARSARYDFLSSLKQKYGAQTILTAHHKDDVLETMCINMIRGTGRKGLTALASSSDRVRPLLHMHKAEIVDYALRHNLAWVEDATNYEFHYLRNRIRDRLARATTEQKELLFSLYEKSLEINKEIENILDKSYQNDISRRDFIYYEHVAAKEVLAHWLRRKGIGFDQKMLEYLAVRVKTAPPSTVFEAKKARKISFYRERIVAN